MRNLKGLETLLGFWNRLIGRAGPIQARPTRNLHTKSHRSQPLTKRRRQIAHESRRRNRAA